MPTKSLQTLFFCHYGPQHQAEKWSKRTANYLSLKLLISTTTLLHPPSPRTVETNFWTILSSPFLVFRRVLTAVHKGVQQHLLFWLGKGNYCRVQQWQWQRPTRLVLFLSIQIIVSPSYMTRVDRSIGNLLSRQMDCLSFCTNLCFAPEALLNKVTS